MTRVVIDNLVVQQFASGYDETNSADYQTLGSGPDNGVEFAFNSQHRITLKATTGAAFTVKSGQPAGITQVPLSLGDLTINVGAGERFFFFPTSKLIDLSTGRVRIDSDQADSEILIVNFKGG